MVHSNVKISIVTATFNSAATVSDTVSSVLNQTYPAFEYVIVDGLSTDDTLGVIERFAPEFESRGIKYTVVSEKDDGMYDAMNKGIKMCSGDIIGIINSDDWYEPDALMTVASAYEKEPFELFYADLRLVRPDGRSFIKHSRNRKYATSRDWNHPTTFIARSIYEKNLYLNDSIHDDYDLILRLKKEGIRTTVVRKVLANFRMAGVSHKRSITAAVSSIKEKYRIYRRNGYSRLYIIEPLLEEVGKLIIG
ncbi:MAG: glycosyltransferase [Lachnospiraceae bacterium]|nr:glycosyltransferase [Lachnospiraceae bacterium]